MKLNEHLLGLILFLQRARLYYISKSEVCGFEGDWYRFAKEEYEDLPDDIFELARVKRNNFNFEEALYFVVTPEMMNCESEKLDQFITAFMPLRE